MTVNLKNKRKLFFLKIIYYVNVLPFIKKLFVGFTIGVAILLVLFTAVLAFIAILFLGYAVIKHVDSWKYIEVMSRSTGGRLGPIGDFIGGVLNPILTCCSLFVVLVATYIQGRQFRKQLSLSRDETLRSQISKWLEEELEKLNSIIHREIPIYFKNPKSPMEMIVWEKCPVDTCTLSHLASIAVEQDKNDGSSLFIEELRDLFSANSRYKEVVREAENSFSFFHQLCLDHIKYCALDTVNRGWFMRHNAILGILYFAGAYSEEKMQRESMESLSALIAKNGSKPEWAETAV